MQRPGVELATSQSQVRRLNHYTTEPPGDSVLGFSGKTVADCRRSEESAGGAVRTHVQQSGDATPGQLRREELGRGGILGGLLRQSLSTRGPHVARGRAQEAERPGLLRRHGECDVLVWLHGGRYRGGRESSARSPPRHGPHWRVRDLERRRDVARLARVAHGAVPHPEMSPFCSDGAFRVLFCCRSLGGVACTLLFPVTASLARSWPLEDWKLSTNRNPLVTYR